MGNLHIYLPTHTKSTNLFQKTNVKIAFRLNYNTARLTKPTNVHKIPPHNKWKFTNQPATPATYHMWAKTSRSLKLRYEVHLRYIRSNTLQSAYAQHIYRNRHEYRTLNNFMTLHKPLSNPKMLTPCEHLDIQTLHREGNLILEQCPGEPNPLFELDIHPEHTHMAESVAQLPSSRTNSLLL